MTAHMIEVRVDTSAQEAIGLLGHRRPGWLRPFLLLAQRPVGPGVVGDVSYRLAALVEVGDGCHAAALRWWPHAGPGRFTIFTGHLVVCEGADEVTLAVQGEARGGVERANAELLTRLLDLLAGALAEADLAAR